MRFIVYHLFLRLESAGQVVKVDSGLCQPASTPIHTQTGCRLGVTFVHVETDVLRPVHASVERRITLFTRTSHVQHADYRLPYHRRNTSCSCRARTPLQPRYSQPSLSYDILIRQARITVARYDYLVKYFDILYSGTS